MFSLKSNTKVFSLKSEDTTICCFCLVQEGFIITGHDNGDIKVWWLQLQHKDESKSKLIQTFNDSHGGNFPVLQILRLGERTLASYADGKKGVRLWRFMPEDGSLFIAKKI